MSDDKQVIYRFHYELLFHADGNDPYLMTSIEDGEGKVLLKNEYADGSRVSAQKLANGQIIHYDYLYGRGGNIVETTVVLPNNTVQRFFFRNGIPVSKK